MRTREEGWSAGIDGGEDVTADGEGAHGQGKVQGDCSAAQRQLELPLNVHGEEGRSCKACDCSEDMEVGRGRET